MRIAFIGKMFSGKTTAADYMTNVHAHERMAFARPVKELSAEILTLIESRIGQHLTHFVVAPQKTEQELADLREEIERHYEQPKHTPLIISQPDVQIQKLKKVWTFADVEQKKGNPAIRKLLQLVGTELGRELIGYENVWVDKLINAAYGIENVVVDDCRFPNEAAALREHGFRLVRVTRPEIDRMLMMKDKYPTSWQEVMSHASETSLDDFEADMVIYAETVDSLLEQVEGLTDEG